jgi:long-subunit acyl-CoA synthetase (AMP-forming)
LLVPADVTVWEWLFESKQFDENARRNPQVGVTNAATKERLSYLEVKQYAEIVSATLKLLYHMETGDTVMLVSPSSVWYPVVVFAVLRNGGKVVGLSPTSTLEEIVHGLRTSEARFVFTAASSADQALTAADSVSLSHDRIFTLEGQHPKLVSTSQLIRNAAMSNKAPSTQAWTLAQGTSNKDVAGFLSFTSGTTGNPKAVSPPMS